MLSRWNTIQIQLHSKSTLGCHLGTTTGQTSSTHILSGDHITAGECLETGLNEPLLQEGITHLNRRTIIQRIGTELRAGKAGTPHTVPSGCTADINDRVANALRTGFHDFLGLHQTKSHRIHQRIAGIGRIKGHFTTDGGHTNAIAVMGNSGHHTLDQTHIGGIVQGAETQSIEQRNRPSPHRENVAKDSPYTGRSTLKRLHGRGMVVTFNLECKAIAIAQIHHSGVFTGPHQNPGSFCRKAAQ